MSDLIERLRSASLEDLPALLLATKLHIEAQQAEIAEYKKQIERMGSSVQHYENLAMKFSSQADVYSHDRQRAWAEIARLRGLVEGAYWEGRGGAYSKDGAWENSDARKVLEQKP